MRLAGHAGGVAGGQIVDDGHVIALGQQGIDDVRADEAGPPGDDPAGAHALNYLAAAGTRSASSSSTARTDWSMRSSTRMP